MLSAKGGERHSIILSGISELRSGAGEAGARCFSRFSRQFPPDFNLWTQPPYDFEERIKDLYSM
jgi:hypothetical protein